MRTRMHWMLLASLSLGLVLVACGGQQTDDENTTASIQESLELSDTGGLEMTDELPAFGMMELDELDLEPNLDIPELPAEMDTLAGQLPPDPNAPPLPPPCPHGVLKGQWKSIKPGVGLFHGKWAGAGGKVMGHMKGFYGVNKAGQHVLFGKYVSKAGKFVGLIKGRYGKGFFKGHWFDKQGARGVLMGAYGPAKCTASASGAQKCLPGDGNFVGVWRADCPLCKVTCAPGFIQPPDQCICVPVKVVPCKMGQCPQGMFCDLCPPLPNCQPSMNCIGVCAPPVCMPLPPLPPLPPGGPLPAAPDDGADDSANLE